MTEGLQALVGKRMEKDCTVMGQKIKISKLTVNQVMEIQAQVKENGTDSEDEKANFELLMKVIRMGANGAEQMSDDEFNDFPLEELSKLSQEIMKFSGIGAGNPGKSS